MCEREGEQRDGDRAYLGPVLLQSSWSRPWWTVTVAVVRGSSGGGGEASRGYCANLDWIGFVGGVVWHTINLVSCAAGPPTSLCSAGHRGPPTMVRLGAPDQGAGTSRGVVGLQRLAGDRSNILPLDLHFSF